MNNTSSSKPGKWSEKIWPHWYATRSGWFCVTSITDIRSFIFSGHFILVMVTADLASVQGILGAKLDCTQDRMKSIKHAYICGLIYSLGQFRLANPTTMGPPWKAGPSVSWAPDSTFLFLSLSGIAFLSLISSRIKDFSLSSLLLSLLQFFFVWLLFPCTMALGLWKVLYRWT